MKRFFLVSIKVTSPRSAEVVPAGMPYSSNIGPQPPNKGLKLIP